MLRHLLLGASAVTLPAVAQADAFSRIASFPVTANRPEGTDLDTETAPEIIAAAGNILGSGFITRT